MLVLITFCYQMLFCTRCRRAIGLAIAAWALWLGLWASAQGAVPPQATLLFGYHEVVKDGFELFPMWVRVQLQHPKDAAAERDCRQSPQLSCHLTEWHAFLQTQRQLDRRAQVEAVNHQANQKNYVLDIDNYGMADYWATVKEFLLKDGDCEDFAITKYYALRQLGFAPEALRIVVVQDTNLRIPHAVLAVYLGDDILILDNQVNHVVSHRQTAHYVPVYSVNESRWWMHLP